MWSHTCMLFYIQTLSRILCEFLGTVWIYAKVIIPIMESLLWWIGLKSGLIGCRHKKPKTRTGKNWSKSKIYRLKITEEAKILMPQNRLKRRNRSDISHRSLFLTVTSKHIYKISIHLTMRICFHLNKSDITAAQ